MMLQSLGKKEELVGWEFTKISSGLGFSRPWQIPSLKEGEVLVCGFDRGLGEEMILCETLEIAQEVYDAYATGGALRITWYVGSRDPLVLTISMNDNDFEFPGKDGGRTYDNKPYFSGSLERVVSMIAEDATNSPSVMLTIGRIAENNPGAASACRELLKVGGEESLRLLVEQGITGRKVWGLFNDICNRDTGMTMQMLRDGSAKDAVAILFRDI